MGKKKSAPTAAVVSKKAIKKVKFNLPPSSEEEDVFEKDGYIGLSDKEEEGYSDDMEEAVLDLPQTSSEEEDLEDLEDEDILEEREEEEEEEGWGKQRKNYYDADKQADLEEEAEEAAKLQKKRLAQLSPQDFSLYAPKFKKSEITLSDDDDDDEQKKEEVSLEDAKLTEEFKQNVKQLKEVLEPFMERAKELPRSQGLKFLSVKYQLLGNYCALIIRYLQLKLSSGKQKGEVKGLVDELIRHRLLLAKMKPMELKLKHQIEKLLNAQPETKTMKAAVGSFADDDDDKEGEGKGEEEESGIYKPPQVTPMPFPGQRQKKDEKERFPELQSDYEEVPEEEAFNVAATSTNKNRSLSRKIEEREEYEEDNFVRFTLSRQEKNKLQKTAKLNDELDDLEDFMDVLEKKHKKKDSEDQLNKKPKQRVQESDESITDYSSSEQEQLIQKAKSKKHEKAGRKSSKPTNFRPVEDIERGAERPASKSILANKGLTTSRPKDIKNPRVKQRRKFERAVKRLPSLHPVAKKGKQSGYGGESSGIRTNISRSTKF